jgi:polar amino acid transport system substrate-binding protein
MAGSAGGPGASTASLWAAVPVLWLALFAAAAHAQDIAMSSTAADGVALAEDGREVFNSTCAYCHGPDAVQALPSIDLRLLRRKYGDRMRDVFFKTVTDGRPAKGMPAWKYVFTPGQLAAVFAYVKTLQSD